MNSRASSHQDLARYVQDLAAEIDVDDSESIEFEEAQKGFQRLFKGSLIFKNDWSALTNGLTLGEQLQHVAFWLMLRSELKEYMIRQVQTIARDEDAVLASKSCTEEDDLLRFCCHMPDQNWQWSSFCTTPRWGSI